MKKLLSIVFIFLFTGACASTAAAALTSGSPVIGSGGMCRDGSGVISPCVSSDSLEATQLNYTAINNWDTAVAVVTGTTGVDDHDHNGSSCKVTINAGDASLIDIAACEFHLNGPEYEVSAAVGINPDFQAGENSRFVGVTLGGYTTQTGKWSAAQQDTLIPLARLNTALGDLGPGSDVHLLRDDRYFIYARDHKDRLWMEEAIGAKYALGGELFSYSSIVMGQHSGILYNSQRERQILERFTNMSAIFIHHSSSVLIGTKERFVVDNVQYDDGTDLNNLISNRWTNISILKSPKGVNGVQEGGWFYVYGDQYLTQAAAETATFDFAEFVSQGFSGMAPLATIIIKQGGGVLDTDLFIIDRRPCDVCRP